MQFAENILFFQCMLYLKTTCRYILYSEHDMTLTQMCHTPVFFHIHFNQLVYRQLKRVLWLLYFQFHACFLLIGL